MSNDVASLIEEIGPTLSSNVVLPLCSQGLDPQTARQRVSRVRGSIRRLNGITFPNRERFLFHSDQYQSDLFKTNLAEALVSSGSAYGRLLAGLEARGGSSPTKYLPIVSGQPILNAKRQLLHSLIQSKLESERLIQKTPVGDTETMFLWNAREPSERRRAVMVVEDIFLGAMRIWLMKINWTSTNTPAVRSLEGSSLPTFGQFAWDLVAPSYLNAVRGYEKKQVINGYIVADILLGREVSIRDLGGFLNKWSAMTHQNRRGRFQPIFIANLFREDALHLLRKRGCMIATPEVIFGEEAAKQLMALANTIENAAKLLTENPQAVFKLMSQVSRWEGASLNLRGVVLEMMVGHLYQSDGYQITFRQQVRDRNQNPAEIDVKAVRKEEIVCCECKALGPGRLINESEIQDWVERSQPRIKEWLAERGGMLPEKKRFEFYVSTDYTPRAREYADKIARTHLKQPVTFFSGDQILKKLRDAKEGSLVDSFREQFS